MLIWTKFSMERKNPRPLITKNNRNEAIGCFFRFWKKGALVWGVENIPDPTQVVRFTLLDLLKILLFQADYVGVITSLVF